MRLSGQNDSAAGVDAVIGDNTLGFVFFTPRGVGQNSWNKSERSQTQIRRRFYLLGQTADTMRVFDICQAIDLITIKEIEF